MVKKVRVWDLPTRLFHWALAVCFVGLVITSQVGGEAMVWHFRLGYSVLSLLLFRLVWGVVGGRWSRFASFIYAPTTLIRYLKGEHRAEHAVGHNPLGALSVWALLGFVLLQVAAGLFSDDEIATAGPLSKMASGEWVGRATEYHTEVGIVILIALVVLHIAAVLFYRFKKNEDLISPMLHGDKQLPDAIEPSRDDAVSRAMAAVVFLLCAGAVTWLVRWAN